MEWEEILILLRRRLRVIGPSKCFVIQMHRDNVFSAAQDGLCLNEDTNCQITARLQTVKHSNSPIQMICDFSPFDIF